MNEKLKEIIEMRNGKELIAGKPNWLIQSRQGFKDVHEYRLFLGMLLKAYEGTDITKPFELDIAFIIQGRGGQEYECLKEACSNIMSRVVDLLPHEKKRFKLRHLVRSADYSELAGTGKLKVAFDPDVVPYIQSMIREGHYTRVFLKHALPIRSLYSVLIYELLLQYKSFGSRDLSLEELRFFLDVPEDKFKQWIHIKNVILLRAQRNLKQHTDIQFEFEPITRGRKVTGIHFVIMDNIPEKPMDTDQLDLFDSSEASPAIDKVPDHVRIVQQYLWPQSQKEVLEKFSKERIMHYYNSCRRIQESGKHIADFSSFFYSALCEDRDGFEEKQMNAVSIREQKRKEEELKKRQEEEEERMFSEAEIQFNLLSTDEQQKYLDRVPLLGPSMIEQRRLTAVGFFMREMKS